MIGVGRPIERSLRGDALHLPVIAYIAVSGAVVMTGAGTGRALIVLGTLAFAASDGLLGADRFLEPARDRRVWVHVLYQLGQAGIVLGAHRRLTPLSPTPPARAPGTVSPAGRNLGRALTDPGRSPATSVRTVSSAAPEPSLEGSHFAGSGNPEVPLPYRVRHA